jgi:hypothetical protein
MMMGQFSISILKNLGYRAPPRRVQKKTGFTQTLPGLGSLHSIAPKPIVGIVIIRARHSAKI